MTEATLTATTPVQGIKAGTIMLAQLEDDRPQLVIVADLADDSDTVWVVTPSDPDSEDLTTRVISRGTLTAAPHELEAAQQDLAQRLTLRLAADAGARAEQMREQANAAHRKIASMRTYAIDKHLDGTICRDGLNDFLAAHDLDLYQPRHSARVTVSLDVEVYEADDRYEAARMIRNCIEVSSNDDDEVRVTSERDLDI